MFTNMPVLLLIHLCDIDIGTDNLFVKNSAIHTFSCVFCTRALINGLRHWLAALGLCCPITDVMQKLRVCKNNVVICVHSHFGRGACALELVCPNLCRSVSSCG